MPTMERKRGQLKLNPKQKLKLIPIFLMEDTMDMQDILDMLPTMASMCKRPEESQNNLSQFSITSCKVYLHRSSNIRRPLRPHWTCLCFFWFTVKQQNHP